MPDKSQEYNQKYEFIGSEFEGGKGSKDGKTFCNPACLRETFMSPEQYNKAVWENKSKEDRGCKRDMTILSRYNFVILEHFL